MEADAIKGRDLVFALICAALVVGLLYARLWSLICETVADDYEGIGSDFKRTP